MPLTLPLALLLEPAGDPARAVALAEALSVPLIDDPPQTDLLLVLGPEGLALRRPNDPELPGVLRVDFDRPAARQRQRQPHRELVVQAARLRGAGNEPLLVDATAGLGRDGFLLAAAGFLPTSALAAWPQAAFDAKTLADAVKALGGGAPAESKDVTITGPDIAENGAVVPVGVVSNIPKTEYIAIMIEKNPNMLAASFTLPEGTLADVQTRVKMGQTSDVYAVVKADGKFYMSKKEIKVTLGGCGG